MWQSLARARRLFGRDDAPAPVLDPAPLTSVDHASLAGTELVVSLARITWWRAPLAFFVLPLAPYWGWVNGMRMRVVAWAAAVVVYAVGVAIASS